MIRKLAHKNEFNPGLLGIIFNPFYISRKALSDNIRELSTYLQGRILDVGSGKSPYKIFFQDYTSLEFDKNKPADFHYIDTFPFNSEFDGVLCTQVLEHSPDPEKLISEIHRVLKPGGKLLLTVPFAWSEHEIPNDYQRYSSYGIRKILKEFRIIEQRKTATGIRAVIQILIAMIYDKNKYLGFLSFPLTMLGLLFKGGDSFYLDNVVLAEKWDHK